MAVDLRDYKWLGVRLEAHSVRSLVQESTMNRSTRGFSLIEMVIVVAMFGLLMAFAVPAVQRLGRTHGLKGARDDMSAQIQLARARAIASGDSIPIHFYPNM